MGSPFQTRQQAENYVARLPADQRPAMRARLGLDVEMSPLAQAVPVREKQVSGLESLPPARKVVHSESAQNPALTQAMRTIESTSALGFLAFSLPFPPSVNAIWRATVITHKGKPTARILLSREGKAYRRSVINVIRSLGHPKTPPGARLALTLTAHMPDRRARDLSNLPKALEDALTHAGVWADDSLIDELRVIRGEVISGGRVDVQIMPVTDTLFAGQL